MEDRRVTRSMTSSQNGQSSKRSLQDSPSPPGQSSSTSAPRKTQRRSVAFLHPKKCKGKPKSLAYMSRQLMQNRQLLVRTRDDEETPLMAAVLCGHEKCVKFLLEYKPNLEAVNYDNDNALYLAFLAYEHLVQVPVNSNNSTESFYNIMKMLLDAGSDPNFEVDTITEPYDKLSTIFSIIILRGNIRLVRLLLNYNVDLDGENGIIYLHMALVKNNEAVASEIVKLLLENGAQCHFGSLNTLGMALHNTLDIALQKEIIKAVKYIFLYHGSPIIHDINWDLYDKPYSFIVNTLVSNVTKKIEVLKLMHKFGVNLWENENQHAYISEDDYNFYEEVNKIRGEPLSLKCLSRIKILHTMGPNFVKKYKELEIPTALHEFLEFPDV